ncbi:MAG TPA: hypothetical protein VGR91_15285 [Stellaceae bacterium]|nr:hypothetical protein [Stellaceae bacterium]
MPAERLAAARAPATATPSSSWLAASTNGAEHLADTQELILEALAMFAIIANAPPRRDSAAARGLGSANQESLEITRE